MSTECSHHGGMDKKSPTPLRVGPELEVTLQDGASIRLTPREALTLAETLARRAFERIASEELRRAITKPRTWC